MLPIRAAHATRAGHRTPARSARRTAGGGLAGSTRRYRRFAAVPTHRAARPPRAVLAPPRAVESSAGAWRG